MTNSADWSIQIYRNRFLKALNLSGTFFEKTIDIQALETVLTDYFSGMANYAFSYVNNAMKYGRATTYESIYQAWKEGETAYANELDYPWLGIEEENRLQWRAMQSWNYYRSTSQANTRPVRPTLTEASN